MIDITSYIPKGHDNAIRRADLARLTGLPDQQMRALIRKARFNGEVILNVEDGEGYFRPELPEEIQYVRKFYKATAGRRAAAEIVMERLEEVMEQYPV